MDNGVIEISLAYALISSSFSFALLWKALMERIAKICDQLPLQQYDGFVHVALKGEIEFQREEKEGMQLFGAHMQLTASFA